MALQKKQKIASLHSYLRRSMPETLFGTLAKLLYSVHKNLAVRTLIIQKPVKIVMQNSCLVKQTRSLVFTSKRFEEAPVGE